MVPLHHDRQVRHRNWAEPQVNVSFPNEDDEPRHSEIEDLPASNTDRGSADVREQWLCFVDLSRDAAFAISITVLVGLGLVLLVNTVRIVVLESDGLSTAVTNGVNGILLAVVVLELARTLQAHFTTGSRLRPLIVVAVIAGVRELLAAGVRLTLNPNLSSMIQHELLLQSAVSAGIIGVLVFASRFVREDESLE